MAFSAIGNADTPAALIDAFEARAAERLAASPEELDAARKLVPAFGSLPGGRVRALLERLLTGSAPECTLEWLRNCGVLEAVLPEAAALAGVEQPPEFHPEGDVWCHTLLMFRHFVWRDAPTAWCVLLHDIGKPSTWSRDPDGRIRFFGHEERGAELAGRILDRLVFSPVERDAIVYAVRNHMRFAAVRNMRPARLRRLMEAETFPMELELHRVDCVASHGKLECFDFLLAEAVRRAAEPAEIPPWVHGRDLTAAGFSPGADFGSVLRWAFERQREGRFDSPAAAVAAATEKLQQMRLK